MSKQEQIESLQDQVHKGEEHEYIKDNIRGLLNSLLDAQIDPLNDEKRQTERTTYFKNRILQETDKMKLGPKALHKELLDYTGDKEDEDGNIGYWHNPNAHWDWYVVGGRWDNCLTLKNGQGANTCKVKDLDIDKTKGSIFAVVHDGEWLEKAKMLWWGITKDDKDEEDWQKQIVDILDSLDENAEVTLVDCHI